MRGTKIIAGCTGFSVVDPEGTDTVAYDEVNAIVAYKIDAFTTDLVCCDIETGPPGGEQVRTLHEEIEGFDALMKRFEALPGFYRDWRWTVIQPPFAENRTLLFRRGGEAGCSMRTPASPDHQAGGSAAPAPGPGERRAMWRWVKRHAAFMLIMTFIIGVFSMAAWASGWNGLSVLWLVIGIPIGYWVLSFVERRIK